MFSPPLPSTRHSKSGLTILESLVLLVTAILIALVAVPVLLVKYGYLKQEGGDSLITQPPPAVQAAEVKASSAPPVKLPDAPKLPPPADPLNK